MYSLSPYRQKSLITSQRRYDEMNLILPQDQDGGPIYLGNLDAANDVSLLKSHNIGALMTLCPDPISGTVKSYLKFHQYYYAEDSETFNLSQYFERSFEFIEKVRKTTGLLIHCYAGISRSATILIAYIMKKRQMGVYEAMNLVQARRWQIYPNNGIPINLFIFLGFLKQLSNYEKKLFVYNNQNTEMKASQRSSISFQQEFTRASTGLDSKRSSNPSALKLTDSLADWRKQLRSDETRLFNSQSFKTFNRSFEDWKPLNESPTQSISLIPQKSQKTIEDNWQKKSKPLFNRLSLGSKLDLQSDKDIFENKFNSIKNNVEFVSSRQKNSSPPQTNSFLNFRSQRNSYQLPKKSYLNY